MPADGTLAATRPGGFGKPLRQLFNQYTPHVHVKSVMWFTQASNHVANPSAGGFASCRLRMSARGPSRRSFDGQPSLSGQGAILVRCADHSPSGEITPP